MDQLSNLATTPITTLTTTSAVITSCTYSTNTITTPAHQTATMCSSVDTPPTYRHLLVPPMPVREPRLQAKRPNSLEDISNEPSARRLATDTHRIQAPSNEEMDTHQVTPAPNTSSSSDFPPLSQAPRPITNATSLQQRPQGTHSFLLRNPSSEFRSSQSIFRTLHRYHMKREEIADIRPTANGYIIKVNGEEAASKLVNSIGAAQLGSSFPFQHLSQPRIKTPPPPPRHSLFSCVIRGVDPDLTDEVILYELNAENIPARKAFRIRNASGPTFMVRVLLPTTADVDRLLKFGVSIFKQHYRVEPSKAPPPQPIRCERCLVYNQHSTANCRAQQPVCGHCTQPHPTNQCPNTEAPPVCKTCGLAHPTYSRLCKSRPLPPQNRPDLVAPIRTVDPPTPPANSQFAPPSIEDIVRFFTLSLLNIFPYHRTLVLTHLQAAANQALNLHFQTTHSGLNSHFQFSRLETLV